LLAFDEIKMRLLEKNVHNTLVLVYQADIPRYHQYHRPIDFSPFLWLNRKLWIKSEQSQQHHLCIQEVSCVTQKDIRLISLRRTP